MHPAVTTLDSLLLARKWDGLAGSAMLAISVELKLNRRALQNDYRKRWEKVVGQLSGPGGLQAIDTGNGRDASRG